MNKTPEQGLKAFVLMPFDPEFDAIYNDLIKPPLEEIGYDVKRADSILNQQNILKDVVRGIAGANLVVADLTSLNANVLYELGISHAMQKPTVLLTQSIEEVPFDLRSYRVIQYSIHFKKAPKLSYELKEIGQKAKTGNLGFGNPVADFLPKMRGPEVFTCIATATEEAIEQIKVRKEEIERGLWDFIAEGEDSLNKITETTKRITKATTEIGEKMQKRTSEANKIQRNRRPGTASRMHKLTKATAIDMILYAKELEHEQPKLHSAWESYVENITGLIQTVSIQSKEEKEAISEFRRTTDSMRMANINALEGTKELKRAIIGLKGISQDVNRASQRISSELELIISDLIKADSYCSKIIILLDEKIEQED